MMALRIPPPIQGLFWALFMWGLSRLLPDFNFEFPAQMVIGFVFIALGLSLDLVSIAGFFKARTTINPITIQKASQLVTSGFYRISRNPMYLGMLLLLLGWLIILGNPVNLIPLIGFIIGMNQLQIKPEETILKQKFGAEYEVYSQRVRRWI